MKKQCSEIFEEVFDSNSGGCVRSCDCGIEYFNSNGGWTWEEGELEELVKKSKEHPDKYIDLDCAVSTMEIGGVSIVYGCSCESARRYENFLISEGPRIAQYLRKRAEMLRNKAEDLII